MSFDGANIQQFPDIPTVSAEILASLAAERVKREKEGGINRLEVVNLDCIDCFDGNCYYIGKNLLGVEPPAWEEFK